MDCDEVVQSKKGGRKIQREYENWLKADGPRTVISKRCSFDQGSRSMETGEDDSASKGNKKLEDTRKHRDNVQSRMLDNSSMSWRSELHRKGGEEVEAEVSEIGVAGNHVIIGSQPWPDEFGGKNHRINVNSKFYEDVNYSKTGGYNDGDKGQPDKEVEELTEGFDKVDIFQNEMRKE